MLDTFDNENLFDEVLIKLKGEILMTKLNETPCWISIQTIETTITDKIQN